MSRDAQVDYRSYLLRRHEEALAKEPLAPIDHVGLRNKDALDAWRIKLAYHMARLSDAAWPPRTDKEG